MQTILLINGPNLNKLGTRNQGIYGTKTLLEIEEDLSKEDMSQGFAIKPFQSNHEGDLIDFIQSESSNASGIIINPGGLAHTSIVLRDALVDSNLPTVEVHISNIYEREEFRHKSVTEFSDVKSVVGEGWQGYFSALSQLIKKVRNG